jgi:hypothetical protein
VIVVSTGAARPQHEGDTPLPPEDIPLNDVVHDSLFIESTPGFFVLNWENDSPFHTFADPDDRHFTNGVSLEASVLPDDAFYQRRLDWLDVLGEFDRPRSALGLMLRHGIYTPDDIALTTPQPDDWPYNALLSLGVFLQRRKGGVFDHVQIDGGIFGQGAGGETVQTFVHSILPDQTNPAWADQVATQAFGQGTYQRRWKLRWQHDQDGRLARADAQLLDDPEARGQGFELIPFSGIRAGTLFGDASFGAIARYGWPLPDDFGPTRFYEFTDHTQRPRDELGFSVFARAGGRIVLHNALIRGSSFDDPRLDEQVLVGEFQAGVQLEWRGCVFTYAQTVTTTEFEGQGGENRTGSYTLVYNLAH